jgi:hypothetical protein
MSRTLPDDANRPAERRLPALALIAAGTLAGWAGGAWAAHRANRRPGS